MATTSRLPCHGKHYRCLPVALYSYTLFALALVALPAGASSRLALSILPPNWQQGKVDTSLQSELTNGLPLGLGVVPIDTADAEGKAGRTLATEPARRTNPVDADSETNSESEGCQESRGVPPPAEQQILQRVEEDECSEDCGGVRTESQANLHPAAQPWWGRVAGVAPCRRRSNITPAHQLSASTPHPRHLQFHMFLSLMDEGMKNCGAHGRGML